MIQIDKYNKDINTLCINKINLDETTTVTLEDAHSNHIKLNNNVFNIRYNRLNKANLILFETLTNKAHMFIKQNLVIPEVNRK